ncbi:nucleotidyl transferase, partial [Verminephrobacter sp. Larva24]
NSLGHMIEDYFGDGSSFDCRIRYIREKEFLGTAGALSLLPPGEAHPLVVTNGDILSGIDFGHLVDFHAAGGRSATVCARAHRVEVPYGVIQMSDGCLQGIVEKPVHDHLISAGIYVLSPQVLPRIPQGQALDMPELLLSLIDEHHKIGVFVLEDEWVDVGRHDDLERVRRSFTDQG